MWCDGQLAQTLFFALQAHRRPSDEAAVVFLDQCCLVDGESWRVGFLRGLQCSSVFAPLISANTLLGIKELAAKPGRVDNVLLEYEAALDRHARGDMAVCPLLVGEHKRGADGASVYQAFKVARKTCGLPPPNYTTSHI